MFLYILKNIGDFNMASVSSREQLIDYAMRKLGAPVVEINVDYQQAEDRLDEALDFFTERHFDGVERCYFKHQITATDVTNGYITTTDIGPVDGPTGNGPSGKDIVSVVRVLRFESGTVNMFNVRYQWALNDVFGINRGLAGGGGAEPLAAYDSFRRYNSLIQDFFSPDKSIRFSKVTDKIHIDMDWSEATTVGEYLCVEAYAALDPIIYTKIFNDRMVKKYFTALLKKQWGMNMLKYDGIQLPGGVSLKGGEIYQQAEQEVEKLEEEILGQYELPVDFMTG